MNDLLAFKKEALLRNLCTDYTYKWDNAKSEDDLVALALDANGISYLCNSAVKGWGLNSKYIFNKFNNYINGKKVYNYVNKKGNGYSSELLCCYGGTNGEQFESKSTQICILDSKVIITVPSCSFVEIHAVGSQINVITGLKSVANIITYGNDCHIEYSGEGICNLMIGKDE